MAITSWPFNDQNTSETEFSRWARSLRSTGVEGDPDESGLKPFGDSSGLVVKVPAGFAIIRGHALLSTAEESLSISGGAGQPRIDRVVARLDPASDEITLVVLEGTPAVTPSAPTLQQTDAAIYEMPLARVLVDAGASTISADKVTDEREFLGLDVGRWATTNRPLFPVKGMLGLNYTTSVFEWWTGSTWAQLTPTSLSASVITSGTLSADRLPTVPITKGGTGATTAAAARAALDAAQTSHNHSASDITSGELASGRIPLIGITKGGTGATNAAGARSNLDAAQTSHTHSAAQITSGTLDAARLPSHSATLLTSGTMTQPVVNGSPSNQMGSLALSGSVVADVHGQFAGAWDNDVGAVTRRAVWMSSNGRLGHTSSSRRYKKAIRRAETDPLAILSIEAKYYAPRSKAWQEEQDHEPTFIGFMAEDLAEAGLWEFIWFDEQGRPDGIHYELLGIAAIHAAQFLHRRLADVEDRLSEIEAKLRTES